MELLPFGYEPATYSQLMFLLQQKQSGLMVFLVLKISASILYDNHSVGIHVAMYLSTEDLIE